MHCDNTHETLSTKKADPYGSAFGLPQIFSY